MATIMIVDDDAADRYLVNTVLSHAGYQLCEAADGAEALALAQLDPPDMVIADLMMPTMGGFEFVRKLRENPAMALTPVVFYTATYYLESDARILAKACGVTRIITKPAEPHEILDVVNQSLGVLQDAAAVPVAEVFRNRRLGLIAPRGLPEDARAAARLDAMIHLGLRLRCEQNTERLLGDFCRAARKMIGAQYAMVGMLDESNGRVSCRFATGMSRHTAACLTSPPSPMTLVGDALSERRPRRLSGLAGDPQNAGLPAGHPLIHSLLCAPMISPHRAYGWLCLSERIGAPAFTDEDEGLAQVFAAQMGRICENGALEDEHHHCVARLEVEISERKRAQAQMERRNSQLEEQVRRCAADVEMARHEMEAFSYSLAHDLRQPLRAVDGFTRMISEQHAASLSALGQYQLERISVNAAKMGRLIDGLSDFSRFSQQPLRKREVALGGVVDEVLEQLQPQKAGRQVEVHVDDLATCRADPALLRQVYANLLSNALKFTRHRQPARIEVGWEEDLGRRVYFVKDNGAGFEMEYAEKLFGVFQRLHRSDQFEGTGVGLAITQRIVQRHGGRIWAKAAPEAGAAFYFTLEEADSSVD